MATPEQFQVLKGPGQAKKGRAGGQGRIATLKRLCRHIIRPTIADRKTSTIAHSNGNVRYAREEVPWADGRPCLIHT